jgi:hypothetical protein
VNFILNEATSRPVAPPQPPPSAPSFPYWWRGVSSPEEVQASCETVLFALASAVLKPGDPTPPEGKPETRNLEPETLNPIPGDPTPPQDPKP